MIFMLKICQDQKYFFAHKKEDHRPLGLKKPSYFNEIGIEIKGR